MIHRIDRDTSGIIMIAKKKQILTRLVSDFKAKSPSPNLPPSKGEGQKQIRKIYYAIVMGKLSRESGTIRKKLLRVEWASRENKVQISEKWQTAVTHFKKIWEHSLQTTQWLLCVTEVEVEIETGRMHQIRVHMASLGNPILGDNKYGDKKLNSFFARNYGLTRQALHAWRIQFFHYGRDKQIKLEARIKADLKDFITKIKK